MAVQAIRSPFDAPTRERYNVRTHDGTGCGHHHRHIVSAVQCMIQAYKRDIRMGDDHSQRSVWRYTGRISERLPITL